MDGGKLEMEMSWNTDTPSHISKYLINWILLVFSLSRSGGDGMRKLFVVGRAPACPVDRDMAINIVGACVCVSCIKTSVFEERNSERERLRELPS